MEQLIFILIVALIGFVNWLIQKSAELREQKRVRKLKDQGGEELPGDVEPSGEPVAQEQGSPDFRRLMEALGLPEEAEAPVVMRREENPPPLPEPRQVREFPAAFVPSRKPSPVLPEEEGPSAAELKSHRRSRPAPPAEKKAEPSQLRRLLASRGGLRDAVVLAEILGPPRGATLPQGPGSARI